MIGPALFFSERISGDASLLSESERAHLSRITGPRRHEQSLRAHTLLHRALAFLLGGPPERFEVISHREAAPRIENGPPISLAHSGELVAVLVCPFGSCGVDVEDARIERDFAALSKAAFGTSIDDAEAFYTAWCVKEARFKAGGSGSTSTFWYRDFTGAVVVPNDAAPDCFRFEAGFVPLALTFESTS